MANMRWLRIAIPAVLSITCIRTALSLTTPAYGLPPVRVLTVPLPGLLNVAGSSYTGFIPDVLNAIASMSTLTFQFITPLGTDFGRQLSTGAFTGVAGQLLSGQGDMIAAAMENHTSYQLALSLTTPLYTSQVATVYPSAAGSPTGVLGPAAAPYSFQFPYMVVLENTATRDFLEQSPLPDVKALWANVQAAIAQSATPKNFTEAVNCVSKGLCKFIGRTPAIDQAVANSGGKIKKDTKVIRTATASFAVRPGYIALLGQLNGAITSLQATGQIQKFYAKWFPNSTFVKPPLF